MQRLWAGAQATHHLPCEGRSREVKLNGISQKWNRSGSPWMDEASCEAQQELQPCPTPAAQLLAHETHLSL